jgi:hypothetical protein
MVGSEPTATDRISQLISLVLAGVALSSVATLPAWSAELHVLGSPLTIGLSVRWLLAALLGAVVAVGTDGLIRSVPGLGNVDVRFTATFWILPCLVTLATAIAVPGQFGNVRAWLISLVLLGALLAGVLVAEHGTAQLDARHYRTARLGLNLATYLAAFALFATIYGMQQRSLVSATLVLCVTFPLALEILRLSEKELATTWLLGGVVALVLAELTWALNAWGQSALTGGSLLLLAFYTLTGIAQQALAGRLNRRILLEFATIAAAGLAILWLTLRWPTG